MALEKPLLGVTVLAACYGVILIHEGGPRIAAQRKGCRVRSIELYPPLGITRFSEPRSYFDHPVIAWGGVVVQAIVALSRLILAEFGHTDFPAVNAILAVLGFFRVSVAGFHLDPIRPLDRAIPGGLRPAFRKRLRANQPDGNLGDKSAGSIPIV